MSRLSSSPSFAAPTRGMASLSASFRGSRSPIWRSQTSDHPRRSFTHSEASLKQFNFAEGALSNTPKVFLTKGLSPQPPSAKVMEAVANHINALNLAQQTVSAPSEKSLESFHVLDMSRVSGKYHQWTQALPNIHPFYAVKSNPHPELVARLRQLGAGFDCASKAEIELALAAGAHPDNIIFAHPCKAPADILAAKSLGVKKTTFDSEAELIKIKQLYPEMELVLRIWVDDSKAQCPLSNKYGCPKDEWPGLLGLAKLLKLNVVGVSFHVGSGGNADTYQTALSDARELWSMAEEYGHTFTLLDIGGGFPGIETDPSRNTFLECADIIRPELSKFPPGIQIIAEPGRYFCAESQTLVTMIIAKKLRKQRPAYFVADGLYQSFNCILYDHTKLLDNDNSTSSDRLFPSVMFGQTCDGMDEIASEIKLPYLEVGDWVAFPGMGAYTTAAASRFNGFGSASVIVVPE